MSFRVSIFTITRTKGFTPGAIHTHGEGFRHFEPRGPQEYPQSSDIPRYDGIFFSIYSFLRLDSSSLIVLTNAPVRGYAVPGAPYRLYSDACDFGLAAILQQVQKITSP